MYFSLKYNYYLLITIVAINGFFTTQIPGFAFELATEVSYPAGASISGGILNLLSNIFGIISI
jgi:hypothetical protein